MTTRLPGSLHEELLAAFSRFDGSAPLSSTTPQRRHGRRPAGPGRAPIGHPEGADAVEGDGGGPGGVGGSASLELWRREAGVYAPGLAGAGRASGLRGSRLLAAVDRPDGDVALGLEDTPGEPATAWPLDRHVEPARRLGAAQGAARVADRPWLSGRGARRGPAVALRARRASRTGRGSRGAPWNCTDTARHCDVPAGTYDVTIRFGGETASSTSITTTDEATYRANLHTLGAGVRDQGGEPVLVTPIVRRWFHTDGTLDNGTSLLVNGLGVDLPAVVRSVAAAEHAPLTDLNTHTSVHGATVYAGLVRDALLTLRPVPAGVRVG